MNLKEITKEMGITRYRLAKDTGITYSTLINIERTNKCTKKIQDKLRKVGIKFIFDGDKWDLTYVRPS